MESVDSIFLTAREIPANERAGYVAQACGGDRELRERVEAMLGVAEAAEAFFEKEGGATAQRGGMPVTDAPGTCIGRYKVPQKIGESGMGAVYMAEQCQPVVRKVALKIIKAGMDTRQVIARFEAERQALALMDHPNIAKVFDGGSTVTGRVAEQWRAKQQ